MTTTNQTNITFVNKMAAVMAAQAMQLLAIHELHFKIKYDDRTLIPDRAVTWIGKERDIVDDVQKLYIK